MQALTPKQIAAKEGYSTFAALLKDYAREYEAPTLCPLRCFTSHHAECSHGFPSIFSEDIAPPTSITYYRKADNKWIGIEATDKEFDKIGKYLHIFGVTALYSKEGLLLDNSEEFVNNIPIEKITDDE